MKTPVIMDLELALRICADVHRQSGENEIAEMYEDGANKEAARKLIKEVNEANEQV